MGYNYNIDKLLIELEDARRHIRNLGLSKEEENYYLDQAKLLYETYFTTKESDFIDFAELVICANASKAFMEC